MDIIVISGRKNKTANLIVPAWLLIGAGSLVVFLVFLFFYNLTHFTSREIDRGRISSLRGENKIIAEELDRIERELALLNQQIDTLQEYDRKLRTFASLEPLDLDRPDLGIGGGTARNDSARPDMNDLQRVRQDLDEMVRRARIQSQSFRDLFTAFDQRSYTRSHTPSIMPVQGWFMSGFGYRLDPFTGVIKMHEGLDIAAPVGTPIVAPADGSVLAASDKPGFGVTIEIDHGTGLRTFFAHLQRATVEPGTAVKRGDIIGYVGLTGKTTGPHVHYEVRREGQAVDPMNFILTDNRIVD
jgi:murein DD-endopeptidase MepM/ murein hydrolase activator NlpD